ncbi:MAG: hypothetical protein QOH96_2842 [Blastocatellia bacterium]|nr:hypothetical protein [Blastocatellia bacterium]
MIGSVHTSIIIHLVRLSARNYIRDYGESNSSRQILFWSDSKSAAEIVKQYGVYGLIGQCIN